MSQLALEAVVEKCLAHQLHFSPTVTGAELGVRGTLALDPNLADASAAVTIYRHLPMRGQLERQAGGAEMLIQSETCGIRDGARTFCVDYDLRPDDLAHRVKIMELEGRRWMTLEDFGGSFAKLIAEGKRFVEDICTRKQTRMQL